jgi:hypothetical protein
VLGAAALGLLPDMAQALPVALWALMQPEALDAFLGFVFATPATERVLPPRVGLLSHHMHCALHSLVVVLAITLAAWRWRPALLVPLAGWWVHLALDIPTHSESYYPVPFLYPFTYWGFDGVAWTTPWLLAANYAALLAVFLALGRKRWPPEIADLDRRQ